MALKNTAHFFQGLKTGEKASVEEIFKKYSGKVIHQFMMANGTIKDARKAFKRTLMDLSKKQEEELREESTPESYLVKNSLRNWSAEAQPNLNKEEAEAPITGDALESILVQFGDKYFYPDHRFIVALQYNHPATVEEIYAQNARAVTAYILKNSGTIADAQDIFQDALVALYHMAEEGFVLGSPFKKYLFGICRYMWLDHLRKGKKEKKEESDYSMVTNIEKSGQVSEAGYSAVVLREEEYKLFIQKFKSLSPHCQEIIGLSWAENEETGRINSLKEIAEMLSRDYGYIRKEKSLCVKRLIALVKDDPRYDLLKTLDLWTMIMI